jgi:hypothetical protein
VGGLCVGLETSDGRWGLGSGWRERRCVSRRYSLAGCLDVR